MIEIFQFDPSYLVAFFVLLSMGFLSLIFFFFFHSRHRSLGKLPKRLFVSVFDKTFNVFDPYPEHLKTIQSVSFLLLVLALGGTFALSFLVAAKVFEFGLILGSVVFIVCLNLTITSEAFEVGKNINIFLKAIGKEAGLGIGDVRVLFILKESLKRLRLYYLSLAVVFFVSSVALPQIMPGAIWGFAQLTGALLEATAPFGAFSFLVSIISVAVVAVLVQVVARSVKSKILSFPSSDLAGLLDKTFEFNRARLGWVAHHEGIGAASPEPEPKDILESDREEH